MRTTLTLDPDVAAQLKERAKREDKPFKQLVNELLRRGMSPASSRGPGRPKFEVNPHRGGFRPGVDWMKLNQLADELDADDFITESAASLERR